MDDNDWNTQADARSGVAEMDCQDVDTNPSGDWGDGDWNDDGGAGWDEEDKQPAQPKLMRQISYGIVKRDALEERRQRLIRDMSDFFTLDVEDTACVLRHFGWKSKKLQDDWITDRSKVLTSAGLSVVPQPKPAGPTVQCSSAFCDMVPLETAFALKCGHYFCTDCWQAYLVSQIDWGRTSVFTHCMGIKCTKPNCNHKFGCTCDQPVPESVFARFVTDQQRLAKYQRWILDNFVEGQSNIKWCPNPKCERAVEYGPEGPRTVVCQCGEMFCFSCEKVAHVPAPCDLARKWIAMDRGDDDATATWLAARTKQCPKCQVYIEKNKACNHMRCAKCGHDFCWLCKGPWSEHGSGSGGFYVCNKYNEQTSKGNLSDEEKKIMENQKILQKRTFYTTRFGETKWSVDFLLKLRDKYAEAASTTHDSLPLNRVTFVFDAFEKLLDALRVLQWTYCMAYYLQAGRKKNLFEHQQQLLIQQTDGLKELFDNNSEKFKQGVDLLRGIVEKRDEVLNRTASIERFRREMIAHVENGDLDDVMLTQADHQMSAWACTACTKSNKLEADVCSSCQACRKHGEMDCKACRKPG